MIEVAQKNVEPGAQDILLDVRGLTKRFELGREWFSRTPRYIHAVDDVSFRVARGRTLSLVGESGCGKTTVSRLILRLLPATAGEVTFEGKPVFELPRAELRALRQRMQIIFQDPYSSLNPRMTVGAAVAEPLVVHRQGRGRKLRERVAQLFELVGLDPDAMNRYPHEFSGGQRQRIGIARALVLNPAFIVCDEPTSALDVSVRAQVINLLQDLQRRQKITYLMISHDLGTVRHLSHDVAVMYLGRLVELAPTETLFKRPAHPYTQMLLKAIPVPNPARRHESLNLTEDEIPSPIHVPSGCPFHPRCPLYVQQGKPAVCREQMPELRPVTSGESAVAACHFVAESIQSLSTAATTVT